MFTCRLHLEDGSDVGEASYPSMVKVGEELFFGGGRRFRCSTSSRSTTRTRSTSVYSGSRWRSARATTLGGAWPDVAQRRTLPPDYPDACLLNLSRGGRIRTGDLWSPRPTR